MVGGVGRCISESLASMVEQAKVRARVTGGHFEHLLRLHLAATFPGDSGVVAHFGQSGCRQRRQLAGKGSRRVVRTAK